VRTDRVRLVPLRDGADTGWSARVERVEYLGRHVEVSLALQPDAAPATRELTASIEMGQYATRPWREGDQVAVSWNPQDLRPLARSAGGAVPAEG